MDEPGYTLTAEVWLHPGEAGWHFVTLPPELADDVRARSGARARPFGSIPATATIGRTTWSTSLFADPVNAGIARRLSGIVAGWNSSRCALAFADRTSSQHVVPGRARDSVRVRHP